MTDEAPPPERRRPAPLDDLPTGDLSPDEYPNEVPESGFGIRRLAATKVAAFAFVAVVAIVVVALVTGAEARDLPWGAIIGVLVLIGAIFVIGRRRQLPPE